MSAYEKYKSKLWCDLKNDAERVDFLECGRAWETGIVAQAFVSELIEVYSYRLQHSRDEVKP